MPKPKITDAEELDQEQVMIASRQRWTGGVQSERQFWDNWLQTGGARWQDDFRSRLNPDREVDPEIDRLLGQRERTSPPRVLDVGAGPLSCLGFVSSRGRIDLTPVDPLAPVYDEFLALARVEPVVRTKFAPAEALSAFFPASSFDLVHCRNALDHSINPFGGIVEMLRVTRRGGTVVLRHAINEAENENYFGLHQWNFDLTGGEFVIWNKQTRIVVDASLPIECSLSHFAHDGYLETAIHKQGEFDPLSSPCLATQQSWEQLLSEAMKPSH